MSKKKSSNQIKGGIGELLAQAEFLKHGFHVYNSVVDDIGIDFIAENDSGKRFYVQVKTVTDGNYTFIRESEFRGTDDYLVLYTILDNDGSYDSYIIPESAWVTACDEGVLSHRLYDRPDQKSEEEYGIRTGKGHRSELNDKYSVEAFFKD